MAEDLGTRPEDARVAALIAAADRLATPLDLDRLDRRPVRRGGVLAAIVVAGALLALVAVTTLSGGDGATADDVRTTPTTIQLTATIRSDAPATTADGATSAASVRAVRAATTSTSVGSAGDEQTASTTASPEVGAPTGASPNAAQGNAPSTSTPVVTTAAPVPAPGNLPGSPTTSPVGAGFTSAGDVTLAAGGDAPVDVRSIVFVDGVLHLRGRVPDRATADGLEENIALAAFGRAVVSAEYVVDDEAPDSKQDLLTTEGTTLFLPESEDITPAAAALLDIGAALLRENPRMTWTVEVHTDNLGSDSYNLTLSQRRADAMAAALVSRGADPAQLVAVGKGEAEPIADNATRPGREANRRVEIEIGGLLG